MSRKSGRSKKIMDQDKRIFAWADDMIQTVPAVVQWSLGSDGTGINTKFTYVQRAEVRQEGGSDLNVPIAQALYYSKQKPHAHRWTSW